MCGDSGEAPQPFPIDNFFFTMNSRPTSFTIYWQHFLDLNSFDFKLPQDRQTNTGDSGEAPQPFPTDNISLTMNRFYNLLTTFFYYEQLWVQTAKGQTNRHRGFWGSPPTLPNWQHFFFYEQFFLFIDNMFLTMNSHSSNRHVTDKQTLDFII